jgi:hypothetical protein
MTRLLRRSMERWDERLANRTDNRVERPFEWGLEWTADWPAVCRIARNGQTPEAWLRELNRASLLEKAAFFAYGRPRDYRLEGEWLSFTSPVATPFEENNVVRARWFPAKDLRRAVVVLPHWNARPEQHVALCRGLQALGIGALRLSLPYHDRRMPAGLERADYAVSANLGRTIAATRQAAIDTRSAVDWLEHIGVERIGIVGTSLGSCYGFLASAFDPRLRVNVFSHFSAYFAEVVWQGLSTRHVRRTLEGELTLAQLREAWQVITPLNYCDEFARHGKKCLFSYALYDTTFPPEFSRELLAETRARGVDQHDVRYLCGHYSLGEFPFKYLAGYRICSFLKRNL